MQIILSNSLDLPIYMQIKQQIQNEIIQGALKPLDLLPSIRALARDLKVSVITTKKAYENLEQEGYIQTKQGQGCFVANKGTHLMREEQLKKIEGHIKNVVNIAKISKISKEEILDILDIYFEEE
ncbi:MAG: GntR family transcriptional regulator [Clostridia bacterium]